MAHLIKTEQISDSYQKQILGSIGKFYQLLYSKELDLNYLYPKRKKSFLPKYIAQEEFEKSNWISCTDFVGNLFIYES